MPRKHPECDPEKVEISEIRGHVPSIQAKYDPGKEETSEIRGHVQAIPIKINPGKENISEIRGQVPGITARFAILKSEREIHKKHMDRKGFLYNLHFPYEKFLSQNDVLKYCMMFHFLIKWEKRFMKERKLQ